MPRTKVNYGVIGSAIVANTSSTRGIFTLQDAQVGFSLGTFPNGPLNAIPFNYLVQGGGGGGSYGTSGSHFGAGGAAGIARAGTFDAVTGVSYTITIGAGGAGG